MAVAIVTGTSSGTAPHHAAELLARGRDLVTTLRPPDRVDRQRWQTSIGAELLVGLARRPDRRECARHDPLLARQITS